MPSCYPTCSGLNSGYRHYITVNACTTEDLGEMEVWVFGYGPWGPYHVETVTMVQQTDGWTWVGATSCLPTSLLPISLSIWADIPFGTVTVQAVCCTTG